MGRDSERVAAAVTPKSDPKSDSPVVAEIGQLEDPDKIPAVDPEHLPPEGDAGIDALDDQTPDLKPMPEAEARRLVLAWLKSIDKVTAIAFRIDTTPPAELDEYSAAIRPALSYFANRINPKVWVLLSFLSVGGFLAARILEAVRARRSSESGSAEPGQVDTIGDAAEGARSGLGTNVVDPGA